MNQIWMLLFLLFSWVFLQRPFVNSTHLHIIYIPNIHIHLRYTHTHTHTHTHIYIYIYIYILNRECHIKNASKYMGPWISLCHIVVWKLLTSFIVSVCQLIGYIFHRARTPDGVLGSKAVHIDTDDWLKKPVQLLTTLSYTFALSNIYTHFCFFWSIFVCSCISLVLFLS